jgi:hypothetical protein
MLLVVMAMGCGRDEPVASSVMVPFAAAPSGATDFGDVPFPSDLYLDEQGQVGDIPGLERVATNAGPIQSGLSALDGFGRSTGALFFLDAEVDPISLPRTWEEATRDHPSVVIVDLETPSLRYPALAKALPTLGAIAVIPVPGEVLLPGRQHAAVLTSRIRTVSGSPLSADPRLRRLADLAPEDRKTRVEKIYGAAYAALVGSGVVDADEIASLAVFRTSSRAYELPRLRDRLRELPEPELALTKQQAAPYSVALFSALTQPSLDDWLGDPSLDEKGEQWPGGDNPGGIAHDAIRCVASGAFVAPSLLSKETKHFERGADGEYVIADPNAQVPVTIVIPKSPMPKNGYPVVINGHGLSNNRGSMLSVANELARAGFAMIGIDDVLHGARAGLVDEKNNYPGDYQGPDGIPDELPLAVSFFAGFNDFVAVRDNFRQTVLDQVSLVRLIQSSKLDLGALAAGAGVPKFDPSRIYWSGGSLGGIMGTMTVAVEPEIRAAALQVPGAGFVQFITTGSAKLAPLVGTLAKNIFGIQGEEVLDEFHPVATLLGAITEAGDPIAYAPHVMRDPLSGRSPPDVLVTYAIDDEVLPNIATVALIRALGLQLASPYLDELPGIGSVDSPASGNLGGHTGVAVQYAPANHALGYVRFDRREFEPGLPRESEPRFPPLVAPFDVEAPIREHCDELVEFLTKAGSGAGVVAVTAPPVADFDGDGVLDDVDGSPWDPTKQ